MIRKLSAAVLALSLLTGIARAQTPPTGQTGQTAQNTGTAQPPVKKVVTHYGPLVTKSSANLTVNLGDVGFTGSLPFDEAFGITVPIDGTVVSVAVWYRLKPKPYTAVTPTAACNNGWTKLDAYPPVGNSTNYQFTVPALKPNKYYQFFFSYKRKPDAIDKAALTTFTQQVIGPALEAKARTTAIGRRNFEFTNGEVNAIMDAIKGKIRAYVALKNLSVDFSLIDYGQYANLFNTLKNVSNAHQTSEDIKHNIEQNDRAFAAVQARLKHYRDTYNASGHTPVIAANVKLMDDIALALPAFLTPPLDPSTITAGLVSNYTTTCTSVLSSLGRIDITGDATYATLADDLGQFVQSNRQGVQDYYQSLQDATALAGAQSSSFVDIVTANLSNDVIIKGTTISGDFNTSASFYVSGDLGIAAVPQFSKAVPYLGTNIYFRPVNKDITLAGSPDDSFGDKFGRRFSLMFGLSIATLAKTNYRTDLFGGSYNLVTGAGFRITDYFRLNTGAIWYQKLNDNPLNSNSYIQPAFFVSFSIDLDVKTALDSLFPTRKP
ncbi:MAG: hypothetical protein JWP37_3703 [Mucilaginibacter sp.]|nr:hypothetical protein [Mucilaginibacter sp.]